MRNAASWFFVIAFAYPTAVVMDEFGGVMEWVVMAVGVSFAVFVATVIWPPTPVRHGPWRRER